MMWYSETLSFLHTIHLTVFAAYAVLITLVLLAVLKVYNWLTTGVYRGTTSMKGKTVIVTGANSGNTLKTFKIFAVYYLIVTAMDCVCFLSYRNRKRDGQRVGQTRRQSDHGLQKSGDRIASQR